MRLPCKDMVSLILIPRNLSTSLTSSNYITELNKPSRLTNVQVVLPKDPKGGAKSLLRIQQVTLVTIHKSQVNYIIICYFLVWKYNKIFFTQTCTNYLTAHPWFIATLFVWVRKYKFNYNCLANSITTEF